MNYFIFLIWSDYKNNECNLWCLSPNIYYECSKRKIFSSFFLLFLSRSYWSGKWYPLFLRLLLHVGMVGCAAWADLILIITIARNAIFNLLACFFKKFHKLCFIVSTRILLSQYFPCKFSLSLLNQSYQSVLTLLSDSFLKLNHITDSLRFTLKFLHDFGMVLYSHLSLAINLVSCLLNQVFQFICVPNFIFLSELFNLC